ncbi:MAG: c-type cytochrome [Hyphomicrobiaceae bacterium]
MQRHWTFMHQGVPKAYVNAQSPLKPLKADITLGGALYAQHCGSCHGKSGMGDGEAGKSLTPSPALLAWLIQRPVAVDEYLLWTISDGGAAFKTDMPAFKDTLSREEVWRIIAYMRAGFPAVAEK